MHTNLLSEKHEGKRPRRRPGRRWEGNVIIGVRGIGWEGVDWMHLADDMEQCRSVVITVMNLWVPYKTGNFLSS
jgi:hypothetical protein